MKKFIGLGIAVAVVVGLIASGTWAVFTDTETNTGNTFSAGTIDISLDPSTGQAVATVDGTLDLKPCQTGWININVTNIGTNPCELWKHIGNVLNDENEMVEPEEAFYEANYPEGPPYPAADWKISDWIHYDMTVCRDVVDVVYLVETDLIPGDSGWYYDSSTIYTVVLDDVSNKANLTQLTVIPSTGNFANSFDVVAALAATPDGDSLYVVDRDSAELARYDIATDTWTWIGDTNLVNCVQLACALDGTLYASSNNTDDLYTIDTSSAATTNLGNIQTSSSGGTVNVEGADLVVGVDESTGLLTETLYLWSSATNKLYSLVPQTSPTTYVLATLIGGHSGYSYSGLAVTDGGAGVLLGSTTSDDINTIDRTDGSKGTVYDMWDAASDTAYDHKWGDMTSSLVACLELIVESDGFYLTAQGPLLPPAGEENKGGVECNWIYLGVLEPGEQLRVSQSYHLDSEVGNWGQSDKVTFDMDFVAQQIEGTLPPPPGPVLPGHGRPAKD